ncbi:MAG: c-type cytochrome domain-containing protein, partial [Pirellulaceae bacterium]
MRLLLAGFVGLTVTLPVMAAEPPAKKSGSLIFEKDIFPILKAKCSQCHFGEKPKGGLNLERRATIIRGGQNGPAIRISAAETSLLFEVLSSDRMPLQGPKLTQDEKGLIRTWINEGAPTDSKEVLEVAEAKSTYDDSEYEYWSFFPPERPALPAVKHMDRVSNPIDAFLLGKLEE